jgi:uncharacterized coiled-coil protein SlyX
LTCVCVGVAFWLRAKFATKEDVYSLDKRFTKIETRMSTCEDKIKQMPSKDDLHQQAIMMSKMAGKIDSVNTEVQGIRDFLKTQAKTINRVEDYLLNKKD